MWRGPLSFFLKGCRLVRLFFGGSESPYGPFLPSPHPAFRIKCPESGQGGLEVVLHFNWWGKFITKHRSPPLAPKVGRGAALSFFSLGESLLARLGDL